MRKMTMFLTAMTLIVFASMSISVFAGGMKDPVATSREDVSSWIGKDVMNTQDEKLGTISDFVWDSDGKLSFAVVSHGGFLGVFDSKVAVPYSALTYDKEKQHFTCDISKDRFAGAPEFKDEATLHDRSFAEDVHRYFGQHPYWTEESMGSGGMGQDY